ncbi:LuxR C-terminal-related transcriptional regulator [Paenibacillus crassostreae]|uniref:Transcriptional regulator n=1 Tax=Paenibacillus crassostreae TaxID=1763538 RepID=A0A167DQA9_9BACL|nr:LuxR C-terminal-related transcriptional regulator [Paenibacillus crassostreae]AOZ91184.1 LuxR family transcriptional regulator [Paenibacillus crassostreae]OAB74657.1 transcriptional regulator [Paenibacillus crassostreae]
MNIPIISTKLFIPPARSNVVLRPRLNELLNEGLHRRLTVISASAGFGKTTLVSEWLRGCKQPVGWLSLDEGDNNLTSFLTYLIAAIQTFSHNTGEGLFGLLQSQQPPPTEMILNAFINEITTIKDHFVLVLDDYHVIDAQPINEAIAFLLEHMPPLMHLFIVTREDPHLPMARLRVQDELIEVRSIDLRFTSSEVAEYLNKVKGLNLSSEDIILLESHTEGWIAGLQLAALSLQGHEDNTSFINSFTGSHRFVLDYLIEEVLQHQSASIQTFLLRTSILDRFCGSLCDAVLHKIVGEQHRVPSSYGQETLEYLERANLFIVPLDNERRWYRYHHLFADLLRQRLHQSITSSSKCDEELVAELHIRASEWYEDNGLEIEAFHHATVANDVDRAARLMEGEGMPLLFRGAVAPVLKWLDSLPKDILDAKPSLWVMYSSALLLVGQMTGVEQKLHAADKALQYAEQDVKTLDLIGHIASIRATMAVSKHQSETIMTESRRALEFLHPDNLPVRTATTWALGYAYQLQGNRKEASNAYSEALSISQKIGHVMITIMATLGLGTIQEAENQLYTAAETYRTVLKLAGNPPLSVACEAHLGLARILYEWNDLDAAKTHGYQSVQLAMQLEQSDRVVAGEVFLARLDLAHGEMGGAVATLAKADQIARQHHFENQMAHISDVQVLVLLQQGNLTAATHLLQKYESPMSQSRVHLAQGNTIEALEVLEKWRQHVEAKGWADERLKVIVLQAVAMQVHGEKYKAVQILLEALTMIEAGGFIRILVDEGIPMYRLFIEAVKHGSRQDYLSKLLADFEAEVRKSESKSDQRLAIPLIEPLSERELEVLHLIAQGLSNREISERLFLALSTVKGHNRMIFDKLQVGRRTEAVAHARKLGLL